LPATRDSWPSRPLVRHKGTIVNFGASWLSEPIFDLRDDVWMIVPPHRLLVALVLAVLTLSACGSSSGSSTSSTTSSGGNEGVAAAKQKCLDATKQIQNSTARSVAEQACGHITTDNANVNAALSKAKHACLTAAAKIPIDSVKRSAEGECKKIGGS
jgi:hypothetical protein